MKLSGNHYPSFLGEPLSFYPLRCFLCLASLFKLMSSCPALPSSSILTKRVKPLPLSLSLKYFSLATIFFGCLRRKQRVMEGLIPFIYRAVAQYRKEGQVSIADLLFDEPSSSPTAASAYFRLAGDSGRHQLFSQTTSSSAADPVATGAARWSPTHRRRTVERGSC